ncbi:MAG: iron transporter [Chloroflexota bacterium]|nr:MAG: iron transporter [Chloroflexota bacterium]
MFAAGLVTFREGLEAALIVGIVISYLSKMGHQTQLRFAWVGVILAMIVSALAAFGLQWVGTSLEEPYEQIFEGSMMFLAVGVLTWMIFWMRYQGRFMKRDLEHQVETALASGAAFGVFGLTFLAVFREGIETALFLSVSAFASDAGATLIGSVIGLALAMAVGYAIYVMAMRLNIRLFFDVTSILLLVFAAGLFAHGIHEFQEIGWLPMLTQSAWNTEGVLSNGSFVGSILRALVGYNATPSVLEVIAYIFYWGVVLVAIRYWTQHLSARLAPTHA